MNYFRLGGGQKTCYIGGIYTKSTSGNISMGPISTEQNSVFYEAILVPFYLLEFALKRSLERSRKIQKAIQPFSCSKIIHIFIMYVKLGFNYELNVS